MTAIQETDMSEIGREIFSHVPPAYCDALHLLLLCVPVAYKHFQQGNVPTAFDLLMEAKGVQLKADKWEWSKEYVIAMARSALPVTYCADFEPDYDPHVKSNEAGPEPDGA